MSDTIKCMKLDYLLLKPYLKSMLLTLLVPMLFPIFTGTLFEGLSFAATVIAMTTGYTFSIVEKNNLERFYGFLPAKKGAFVFGRYLLIFLTGFCALLFSFLIQLLILMLMSAVPATQEALLSLLVCMSLFCIYAAVQIPGYYRFGSIKGKMFMFIPTVGFLLFYFIARFIAGNKAFASAGFAPGRTAVVLAALLLITAIIAISAFVSTKIVEKSSR